MEDILAHAHCLAHMKDGDRLVLHQGVGGLKLVLPHHRWPSVLTTPGPCSCCSAQPPFPARASIRLGQIPEHLEDQPAHQGLGLHVLRKRGRLYALRLQLIHEGQQVLEISA